MRRVLRKRLKIQKMEIPPQVIESAMVTEPSSSKCNWCTKRKPLIPGKKFCQSCSENGRECRWCHRPLPERFYSKRTDVCDRYIDRHRRWQTGGGARGCSRNQSVGAKPGKFYSFSETIVIKKDIYFKLHCGPKKVSNGFSLCM